MPGLATIDDPIPVPPRWLMRKEAEGIIDRRLRTAPAPLVHDILGTAPGKLQYYLETDPAYALISLHPPSEVPKLRQRVRRFGQAFPGLFNINGEPRPHDLRPTAKSQPAFMSKTSYTSHDVFLVGESFGVILRGNCFVRLERDSSIGLSRLNVQSSKGAPREFKYKVHFIYIMTFGHKFQPYDFGENLDKFCVRHFGLCAQRFKLEGAMRVDEAFVTAS